MLQFHSQTETNNRGHATVLNGRRKSYPKQQQLKSEQTNPEKRRGEFRNSQNSAQFVIDGD